MGEVELKAHLHLPPDWKGSDSRPAIVFFFGGGWTGGEVEQFEPQAEALAARGMVAVRADYRVKSRHGVLPDACVMDAKSAIRWVRANSAGLGVDPDRIVAAGGSAGGHIAACTALAPELEPVGEDQGTSSRPNALVLFNPVMRFSGIDKLERRLDGDAELARKISPTLHVEANSPPSLLIYGTKDVLMEQGREYVEAAEKVACRAEMFTVEGQGHGFFNRQPWRDQASEQVDRFLVSLGYLESDDPQWVVYQGREGEGKGKHIVLISGDEEYRSEEALPQLGKILAVHHGFKCTVVFAIDPKTGAINPDVSDNIPGLAALEDADLMVIATRFRDLPDEQMKHIDAWVEAGKPIIGMRTATHAFKTGKDRKYARYSFNSREWKGGFGRQILGETWVSHHGHHGRQSTRGLIAEGKADHSIVRGIENGDVWGPTDVYGVRLPQPEGCEAIIMGQVVQGMKFDDPAAEGKKNEPMMPVAWVKTYEISKGAKGRVFTTTMGAATDLVAEGTRRMLVNACYWALGMEKEVPQSSVVDLVGEFEPTRFGFGRSKKGVMPSEHALKLDRR